MSRSLLLAACLFATWIIWGSTYLGIKLALVSLPPFLLSGIRYSIAGGLMLLISRGAGERWPTLAQLRNAAGGGGLALAIGNGAVCLAEQRSPSGLVALIMAATPLLTVLLNQLLGIRAKPIEWLGLMLGIGGVALIQLQGSAQGDLLGMVIMLGGALAWAVASVMLPRLAMPAPIASCAIQMLGGGAISLLLGAALHEQTHGPASRQALLALAYLVVAGSIGGYSAYLWLLRHTRSALATSFFCVNPIVALVLGALFSAEQLSGITAVGSVLVIASVCLVLMAQRTDERDAPSASTREIANTASR